MFKAALLAATVLSMATAQAQTPAPTPAPTPVPSLAAPSAGGQADMMHMMTLGAHNQLGVLQYCQDKGFIGAETVALQQKMIGMLPPSSTDGVDAAEATGKTGVVSFGGSQTSLEDAAKTQNTTVAALCGKLATALAQAAKAMTQ